MDINIKGMSFDRGIERIISSGEASQTTLPRDGRLAPSDGRAMPRLDQLLHTTTLADQLRLDIAPQIEDHDLLLPDRFHRTLCEIQEGLEHEAAQHTEHKELFRSAAALLREERELDLLDIYRSALFKG